MQSNQFLRLCLTASICFASNALLAQNEESSINTIMVFGDDNNPVNPVRLPQSARMSSQTLDSLDVYKLQARDAYDLLNYGTGVFTTTSGKKSPQNLNIRGDGNFGFIIDGAYVPPQLASRILQTIPADAIAEVRIVRTSTALTVNPLVGIATPSGAANNGFIVVRTKEPTKEFEGTFRANAGSFSTYGADVRIGKTFQGGTSYIQGIASYSDTDGESGFNLDKNYRLIGTKAGLQYGIASLDVSVMKSDAAYGIISGTSKLRPSSADAVWRIDPIDTTLATINGSLNWNERNSTLISIGYTDSQGDFETQTIGLNNLTVRDNDNSFLNSAIRHNIFLGDFNFQIGMDNVHWKNPTGQYYYEGIAREEEVTGYFLQADTSVFDERLNLDAGIRRDSVEIIKGIDYFHPGRQPNDNVRTVRNEKLPDAEFISLGASLRLTDASSMNLRYGQSEQSARRGIALADPSIALQGENRHKYEIGFEGTINDLFRPSVNFFQVKTDNEVTPIAYTVIEDEQVALYGNTNSKRTGVETALNGAWNISYGNGGYRMSVTQYTDVLDPSGLLARTQPDTVAELMIDQQFNSWNVSSAIKYVSQYESNAFTACAAPNLECRGGVQGPYLPVGDFVNIDLVVGREVNLFEKSVRVTASIKNLLDDHYETSVGYPTMGRQIGLEFFVNL